MAVNSVNVLPTLISVEAPASLAVNRPSGAGSDGFIKGVVTEKGLPVSRRVMCYHRKSGALISSTWSDLNGNYNISGLVAGIRYFVTSIDEDGNEPQYNAVTQDLITASGVIS